MMRVESNTVTRLLCTFDDLSPEQQEQVIEANRFAFVEYEDLTLSVFFSYLEDKYGLAVNEQDGVYYNLDGHYRTVSFNAAPTASFGELFFTSENFPMLNNRQIRYLRHCWKEWDTFEFSISHGYRDSAHVNYTLRDWYTPTAEYGTASRKQEMEDNTALESVESVWEQYAQAMIDDVYNDIENAYEWQISDDCIRETLQINEYEWKIDSDGTIIDGLGF